MTEGAAPLTRRSSSNSQSISTCLLQLQARGTRPANPTVTARKEITQRTLYTQR